MQDRTKLIAALGGGYLLGRTKKGGAAVRLYLLASSNPAITQAVRGRVSGLLASPEAKQIGQQVTGPLAEAVQQAALRAVLSRVSAVSAGLTNRTQKLTGAVGETVEGTTETITDTVGGVTEPLRRRRRRKAEPEEEQPEPEPEQDTEPEPDDGEEENRG